MSRKDHSDVIIVGGGVSGLVAARTLARHDPGMRVVIIDLNGQLGGGGDDSYRPKMTDDGEEMELLTENITEDQPLVARLISELQLRTVPTCQSSGGSLLQFVNTKIGRFSWMHSIELARIVRKLDAMASKVCILDPYKNDRELDNITVSGWLTDNCWLGSVTDELCARVRGWCGGEPGQVSLLFLLVVAASCGGIGNLLFSKKLRVVGGTDCIISRLERELEEQVQVITNETVSCVEQKDAWVEVTTNYSDVYSADRVVMCVSPAARLRSIRWKPGLSPISHLVNTSTPVGCHLKFQIQLSQPAWLNEKRCEKILRSEGGGFVTNGPVTILMAHSREKVHMVNGLVAGRTAVEWQCLHDEDLKAAIVASVNQLLARPIDDALRMRLWRDAGCGKATYATPGSLYAWPSVRLVQGRVHFGSRQSATTWIGTMEGAVQAGQRTGLEVLRELRPQCLSAEDLEFLSEFTMERLNVPAAPRQHVFRWTILLPAAYLFVMFLAIKMRNKYSGLLIPFH